MYEVFKNVSTFNTKCSIPSAMCIYRMWHCMYTCNIYKKTQRQRKSHINASFCCRILGKMMKYEVFKKSYSAISVHKKMKKVSCVGACLFEFYWYQNKQNKIEDTIYWQVQ